MLSRAAFKSCTRCGRPVYTDYDQCERCRPHDDLDAALTAARERIAELEGELIPAMAAVSHFAEPGDTVAAAVGRMEDRIIDLAGECVESAAKHDAARADAARLREVLAYLRTYFDEQMEVTDSPGTLQTLRGCADSIAAALATTATDTTGGSDE